MSREREQLDAVAVRVGDLHADDDVIVLPFGLGHAGRAEALAGAAHLVGGVGLEAEVVGGREQGSGCVALAQSLGLNRSPEKWKLDPRQKNLRVKTWWTLLIHDIW